MKIACSTSAFKEDLDSTLGKIAGMGFEVFDLICIGSWDHVNPEKLAADFEAEAGRVERLIAKHGVKPVAANVGLPTPHQRDDQEMNRERLEQAQALGKLLERLGIPVAAAYLGYMGPGVIENEPRSPEEVRADLATTVRELTEIFARHGARFAYEPHWRTPVQTLDETHDFMAKAPDLKLVYDPTHFIMQGYSTADTLFMLDHCTHAHLRDAGAEKMALPYGAGEVDFPMIIQAMKSRGFDKPISLEYLPGKVENPEADLVKMRDELRRLWEEA
jgi:sugar phosphate isomerase/epimerase